MAYCELAMAQIYGCCELVHVRQEKFSAQKKYIHLK